MNAIVRSILVGAVGLTLVAAPLAASAQDRDGHGRGQSYHARDNRGGENRGDDNRDRDDRYRGDRDRYNRGYNTGYVQYQQPFYNGYFGLAPGGFQGYYYNGGWYRHRRPSAGFYIYF